LTCSSRVPRGARRRRGRSRPASANRPPAGTPGRRRRTSASVPRPDGRTRPRSRGDPRRPPTARRRGRSPARPTAPRSAGRPAPPRPGRPRGRTAVWGAASRRSRRRAAPPGRRRSRGTVPRGRSRSRTGPDRTDHGVGDRRREQHLPAGEPLAPRPPRRERRGEHVEGLAGPRATDDRREDLRPERPGSPVVEYEFLAVEETGDTEGRDVLARRGPGRFAPGTAEGRNHPVGAPVVALSEPPTPAASPSIVRRATGPDRQVGRYVIKSGPPGVSFTTSCQFSTFSGWARALGASPSARSPTTSARATPATSSSFASRGRYVVPEPKPVDVPDQSGPNAGPVMAGIPSRGADRRSSDSGTGNETGTAAGDSPRRSPTYPTGQPARAAGTPVPASARSRRRFTGRLRSHRTETAAALMSEAQRRGVVGGPPQAARGIREERERRTGAGDPPRTADTTLRYAWQCTFPGPAGRVHDHHDCYGSS